MARFRRVNIRRLTKYNCFTSQTHHTLDEAKDNARSFQGQAADIDLRVPSRARRSSGELNRKETSMPRGENTIVSQTTTHSSHQSNQQLLDGLLAEHRRCASEATTFRRDAAHPPEDHYAGYDTFNFEDGEVYRLWHPYDIEVHLSSFLILSVVGSVMTCLRVVTKPEEEMIYAFEQKNHKLEIKPHQKSCDCNTTNESQDHSHGDQVGENGESRYLFHLQHEQDIKDDCWVNFTTPWSINWKRPYKFAYCGRLQEDCFLDVRRKYKTSAITRLYPM